MGETACFMQPFSYASGGLSCDHHPLEGNPIHHALSQSISFGRFASESPSWDRWSAFPGNRYVEEAEKFSRPGSVAQKKAFFEAHYKNMAARKAAAAAAMHEQANAPMKSDCEGGVAEDVSCTEFKDAGVVHDNDRSIGVESWGDHRNEPVHGTFTGDASKSHVQIPKSEFERTGKSETSSTSRNDRAADTVNREDRSHYKNMAARKAAAAAAMLEQANAPMKSPCDGGVAEDVSCTEFEDAGVVHDNDRSIGVESWGDHRNEPVHGTFTRDASKSHVQIPKSEFERTGKSETSSTSRDDRAADPVNREDSVQEESRLQFPVSDHLDEAGDVELSESAEMEKPLLKDFVCEAVLDVADQKEAAVVCSKISRNQKGSSGVTSSSAVALLTPRPYWKGNIASTPIGRDSMVDRSNMKRSTPRRRLPLGCLTPVREINKATTTISWRMGNSKPSSGMTKDCRTPAKTPMAVCSPLHMVPSQFLPLLNCQEPSNHDLQAPSHATSKYTLTTPNSVNERTTPAGEGKQTGPKRRSLAKECSKFLSACKNKLQSPSLSTPFRLRTEERAMRRKEKLEEKFNAERERIQLQYIHKEKEEMEAKKFRQTLCFKARPLPKFYRENATATTKTPTKKVVTNCSESTKRSRKPWSSSTTTLSNRISPHFQGKKLVLGMSLCDLAPENRSPNIQ